MRLSIFVYILVFALIIVLLFVAGQRLVEIKTPVRMVDVNGTVEAQPKGQKDWKDGSLGATLQSGDTLRTGADSETSLSWENRIHIWLGPDTELKLGRSRVNRTADESMIGIQLNSGKMWGRLPESPTGKMGVLVKTPDLTAAVPSGIFSIERTSDGTNRIEVFEGVVAIIRDKKPDPISARNILTFKTGSKPGKPVPMTAEQITAWQQNQKIVGAFLSIEQPKEGEQVASSLLTLSGYTDPGNVVNVDNKGNISKASVDNDGKWTVRLTLTKGENVLLVHAVDGEGRQRTISRKVVY